MKSVLISIQPKWCGLIASGKKTVEVRKTKPKLETPFKCYIYCTMGKDLLTMSNGIVNKPNEIVIDLTHDSKIHELNGTVIGEFVCDKVLESFLNNNDGWFVEKGCLTQKEIDEYQGDKAILYGWHISDLVIYDEPKELGEYGEFYVWKKCNSCRDTGYKSTACCFDIYCKVPAVITRPPQSWCYVEELKGE